MLVGYARVSTQEQDTDMQRRALRRAGCKVIYEEQRSAVSKRPKLDELLATLTAADTLVVYKLDRLARSLKQLLTIVEHLETIGAGFKSLTEPINTDTSAGKLMMQMLGAFAEFERSLIVERTKSGMRAAKERGVVLGRQRSIDPAIAKSIVERYLNGSCSYSGLAREYCVHESSVKRAVYRVTRPGHSSLL
jgi:DNA invertase Pin-like site-specific DNA recombinase